MEPGKTTTIGEIKEWVNSLPEDHNSMAFMYRMIHVEDENSATADVYDFPINCTVFDPSANTYYAVDDLTREIIDPTPESETPTE